MENKRLLFLKNTKVKSHPVISEYIRAVMQEQGIHCFDTALYQEQKRYFSNKGYECPLLLEEHRELEQVLGRAA